MTQTVTIQKLAKKSLITFKKSQLLRGMKFYMIRQIRHKLYKYPSWFHWCETQEELVGQRGPLKYRQIHRYVMIYLDCMNPNVCILTFICVFVVNKNYGVVLFVSD